MDATNYQQTGIRRIEVADFAWMMTLAHERYDSYDPGGALRFALQAVNAPAVLGICSREMDAFLVASHVAPPWDPKRKECNVLMVCAAPGAHWQAVKLLRECIAWARLQGCVRWRLHSDTEHDIRAIARRLGAYEDTPRYVIDL